MNNNHKQLVILASLEFLIIIILIAVLIEPYLVTRATTTADNSMSPGMMQKMYELPPTAPVPTISFTITKDMIGGYDFHASTTNFVFTPELINTAPIADQGHIHLYIDGKLSILFGPWYHIDSLSPGKHSIIASLNANDHSVFAEGSTTIEAMETIDVAPIQ